MATAGFSPSTYGAVKKWTTKEIQEWLTSGTYYEGTWNAETNTPHIEDGSGDRGDYYEVAVGGEWNGMTFKVGDKVLYNGTQWQQVKTGKDDDENPITVAYIDENTTSLPTQRPSGKPLLVGDVVKVLSTATLPFTIEGIVIDSINDSIEWTGDTGWQLKSYSAGKSSEIEIDSPEEESYSGDKGVQNEVNKELVEQIKSIIIESNDLDTIDVDDIEQRPYFQKVETTARKAGLYFYNKYSTKDDKWETLGGGITIYETMAEIKALENVDNGTLAICTEFDDTASPHIDFFGIWQYNENIPDDKEDEDTGKWQRIKGGGAEEVEALPTGDDIKKDVFYKLTKVDGTHPTGLYYNDGAWKKFETNKNPYESINVIDDYLTEVIFDHENIDYDFANEYAKTKKTPVSGCSEVRNGNFIGRNLDWYYDEEMEFIIKTNRNKGRFKSIGVCSVTGITKAEIEQGGYNEKFKLLPFHTVDGINENGVYVGVNVVPLDKGVTDQNVEGKPYLASIMIPRLILDYATSAEQGANLVKNYNIYNVGTEEAHFIVADKDHTYLIEFIENVTTITNIDDKPYMTNFHIDGTDFDSDGKLDWTTVEDYGQGLERYQHIKDNYEGSNTKSGMLDLMRTLDYTKAYTFDEPLTWKTEFTGKYDSGKDIKITSTDAEFMEVINIAREQHESRDRSNPAVWQTTHTSVYDIKKQCFYILIQERANSTLKTFTLSDAIDGGGTELVTKLPEGEEIDSGKIYKLVQDQTHIDSEGKTVIDYMKGLWHYDTTKNIWIAIDGDIEDGFYVSSTVGAVKAGTQVARMTALDFIRAAAGGDIPTVEFVTPVIDLYAKGMTASGVLVEVKVEKQKTDIDRLELYVNNELIETYRTGVSEGGQFRFNTPVPDMTTNTDIKVLAYASSGVAGFAIKRIYFLPISYYGCVDEGTVTIDEITGYEINIEGNYTLTSEKVDEGYSLTVMGLIKGDAIEKNFTQIREMYDEDEETFNEFFEVALDGSLVLYTKNLTGRACHRTQTPVSRGGLTEMLIKREDFYQNYAPDNQYMCFVYPAQLGAVVSIRDTSNIEYIKDYFNKQEVMVGDTLYYAMVTNEKNTTASGTLYFKFELIETDENGLVSYDESIEQRDITVELINNPYNLSKGTFTATRQQKLKKIGDILYLTCCLEYNPPMIDVSSQQKMLELPVSMEKDTEIFVTMKQHEGYITDMIQRFKYFDPEGDSYLDINSWDDKDYTVDLLVLDADGYAIQQVDSEGEPMWEDDDKVTPKLTWQSHTYHIGDTVPATRMQLNDQARPMRKSEKEEDKLLWQVADDTYTIDGDYIKRYVRWREFCMVDNEGYKGTFDRSHDDIPEWIFAGRQRYDYVNNVYLTGKCDFIKTYQQGYDVGAILPVIGNAIYFKGTADNIRIVGQPLSV